ncbi:hypothetical protein KCU67_g12308, partial [Aureobasidium melanogenum]
EGDGATWIGGGGGPSKQSTDNTVRPAKKRHSTEVHRGLGPTRSHEPYSPRLSTSSNNGPVLSPNSASGEFTGKAMTEEPPSMSAGESILSNAKRNSTTGVGLQKPIKEVVAKPDTNTDNEAGVGEEVARKANRAS